jgi:hypothetical protein
VTYRATNESSTQTPEERSEEARIIIDDMGLRDATDSMTQKEREFVAHIINEIDIVGHVTVSPKQLWWLRDLKEKYL